MEIDNNNHQSYTIADLIAEGGEHEFVFFWKHEEKPGNLSKACLSQWYPSMFELNGRMYCCAEQAMMAGKAALMNDEESLAAIMREIDPEKIKTLGKGVKNFDPLKWDEAKCELIYEISLAKFSQNESLRNFLLGTGDKVLAEASPYDRNWGIGLGEKDPASKDPSKWNGENLLGFALMKARDEIRRKEEEKARMYHYKYPHPAVTTDCAVFGFDGKDLHILLIERGLEPFKGSWALPGGFLNIDESAEEGARRELREETGVKDIFLEQFHTFTEVHRDPRERVISIAYYALIRKSDYQVIAGDDAAKAAWFLVDELPPLAFDHYDVITKAKEHLRLRLATKPIAFRLLDKKFKMSELQRLYERINGTSYDRRNFAKKMVATGFLNDEGPNPEPEQCRAATLYSFCEKKYDRESSKPEWKKFPFDF